MVLALAARRRLRMQIISCGYRGYNVGVTDFSLDYRLAVVLVSSVQGVEWKKGFRPYLQQVARLGGRRALSVSRYPNKFHKRRRKRRKNRVQLLPFFRFRPKLNTTHHSCYGRKVLLRETKSTRCIEKSQREV